MKPVDALLRLALTALHQLLRAAWSVRRPRTFGAHALALTPDGKLILVKLRYARGWRLPGGGRAPDEEPREAVLRELREEIGMSSHGAVRLACEVEQRDSFKRDLASLLIVEDVRYSVPGWSWEIERVREAALDDLPADVAPVTRRWVEAAQTGLRAPKKAPRHGGRGT